MAKKLTNLESGKDNLSSSKPSSLRYIKFEGDNNELFWRFQADILNPDAEIIVPETHVCIFVKDGMFMDELKGGRHPIFEYKKKFGLFKQKVGAVSVDLVFISKTARLKVMWGTNDPFNFRDELTDMLIHVRAYGEFEVRVANPRKFYSELVGSDKNFTIEDLQRRLLGRLLSEVEPIIYKTLKVNHISFDEISLYKLDIAKSIKSSLSEMFLNDYGLEVCSFVIGNINPLEEEIEILESKRERLKIKQEAKLNAKEIAAEIERLSDKEFERNKILHDLESKDRDKYYEVLKILGWPSTNNHVSKVSDTSNKKICPTCKTIYDSSVSFCPKDGTKLVVVTNKNICPSCHKEIANDVVFCPYCGHKCR